MYVFALMVFDGLSETSIFKNCVRSKNYPLYDQLLPIFLVDGLYDLGDGPGLQLRFELIHLDGYEVELDPFCEVLQIVEGEGAVVLLVAEEEDAEVSEIEGEILVGVDFQHL